MEIKKNIDITINTSDRDPDHCGLCQFLNPDERWCILFNIDLIESETRTEECIKTFGLP